jgi:NTE family protein
MTTHALVLGGGGEAGVAWEIGLLAGLAQRGVDLRDADVVIGTSAGAIVGTLLLSGADLQDLYRRQLDPVPAPASLGGADGAAVMAAFGEALAGVTDEREARVRLGALALRSASVSEEERRASTESRVGNPVWPSTRLVVTAVDCTDGSLRTFEAGSGVSLLDAVAASSAAPMFWPPITIGRRRFMDGGTRSPTNADLATGYDKVLVVAPFAGSADSPLGPGLDEEVARLRERAEVYVVLADSTALPAFGPDLMDPGTREPSARAGHTQADHAAAVVRTFWS